METLSNAEIAKVLLSLAQMLTVQKENPFKIKAYRRAARAIAGHPDSVVELVRSGSDLTAIAGIGTSIAGAVREIVERGGNLGHLETLRAGVGQQAAGLSEYPLLDPVRVQRIYKKLGISSVAELRERLDRGEIGEVLGARMEQHVREGLNPSTEMLLHEAHKVVPQIEEFLVRKCSADRAEAAGEYRRRVEVIRELSFVVQGGKFSKVIEAFQHYGGRTNLLESDQGHAVFQLPSGTRVHLAAATADVWGLSLLIATGSARHLGKLIQSGYDLTTLANGNDRFSTEDAVYKKLGLQVIPPELREAYDEIESAAAGRLTDLITVADIRGELHAHSTSSDGAHTIEQMAAAARERGYEYLGITDHSQSLKIARGVSEADLWAQIRYIDDLNGRDIGIRVLKSAEVDILADGSLDYPDSLLKELDYTVCSIHSKFALGRREQTERVMRAMDNRYFNILGHATGRRLLRRSGYELDVERVVEHAKTRGCFFEINSSPQRLDLSAENARLVREAGVKIAITTDAHSTRELDYLRGGIDQARRAGVNRQAVLNSLRWQELQGDLKR